MDAVEATLKYDRWLQQRLVIDKSDLKHKHQCMAGDAFSFLRATFYRWAQVWPALCPDLSSAPEVLGVGDLHVENFGTWRDGEGRLIWGVNDFDEATVLPYTNDLVRLCASALISITSSHGTTSPRQACDAVLEGYRDSLAAKGLPTVLAEHNRWLRDLAVGRLKEQRTFWDKMGTLKKVKVEPVRKVRGYLQQALPDRSLPMKIVKRRAGLGSLGRQRFTALVHWRGGLIAREAKALTTSAWWWNGDGTRPPVRYSQIVDQAVRVADPFLKIHDGWVVRRLAPDCSRVELENLADVQDQCKLLHMMGWETANVHLGSPRQLAGLTKDLRRRKGDWLCVAASRMRDATFNDWRAWREWHGKTG
jgi:uncharacterized protein (DUF2252 family)